MRTDSLRVSNQALDHCRALIAQKFPAGYLPEKPNFYKSSKEAQGAHEAIRPSHVERTPASVKPYLERDMLRLYELIWNRFVASQMAPGRFAVTDVAVSAGKYTLEAQGKELVFDGHLKITGYDEKSILLLPPLAAKEPLKLLGLVDPTQHFTKPPPRYSEAALVKTLEKLGIGRPSTYAPIISTIQQRSYVKLLKRQFHATDLGKIVTDQLVAHFGDIMDVKFTSHMEDRLDEVEEAKTEWRQALREFYEPFSADLEKAEANMKRPEPETTEYKCDLCGKPMLKRWSARGPFLGCSGYPACRFTQPLNQEGKPEVRAAPEATDEKCSKCGSPMVIRSGRHGRFMACSAYPKCKNTRNFDEPTVIPEELKICDKCGKPMAVRRSRRGPFLGCTGYPECKNAKPLPRAERSEP
jgi:DNA topoisomerase-1